MIEANDVTKSALPERVAGLNKSHHEVVNNITAAQAKQAHGHLKRVRGEDPPDLPAVGTLVYMEKPGKGKGTEGPYKLIKLEKGSATLRDGEGKEWNCNIGRLRVAKEG
jgi:hypothetical protein